MFVAFVTSFPLIPTQQYNTGRNPALVFSWSTDHRHHVSSLNYFTSKPSDRRHCLCSSISFLHSTSSSPLAKMQASRACFVSGQQQQIFFPDLMPTFCELLQFFSSSFPVDAGVGDDAEFPIILAVQWLFPFLLLEDAERSRIPARRFCRDPLGGYR